MPLILIIIIIKIYPQKTNDRTCGIKKLLPQLTYSNLNKLYIYIYIYTERSKILD